MLAADVENALIARITAFADDELVLAQRDAEWTGHAPILEEDIAFANIAQDELGHATVWYGMVETLTGDDGDTLAMFRDASAFRNVQLVELPKGDWAFTMVRQYLFDAYEHILLPALMSSAYVPLAQAVAKMRNEELYHLRHTQTWVARLGLGSAEANRRMQHALTALWPFALQLFVPLPGDARLTEARILPSLAEMQNAWEETVRSHLTACELIVPDDAPVSARSRAAHTAHLTGLLEALQRVARSDPAAAW
jgi:ring-1,2-phenylacetyl-CoA epoxidase subunit PaaC